MFYYKHKELGVTRVEKPDHRPNIQVIGVGQKRDYNKIYNSLVLTEIVPTGTHYLLTLEAPTGKFEAEVTKEVWDTHVLPAYQGISKCEECPCFHIELSEKGDPPETKCGLMQEEIFCHWGEEIDKRCPLHVQPVLLRKAGT